MPFAPVRPRSIGGSRLRSRRHGTEEVLAALPASAATRTAGHLLSTLVAAPVAAALVAGWVVLEYLVLEPIGTPRAAELAVALLIAVGGGAVGVLVARWLPAAVGGVAAVIAVSVIQDQFMRSDVSPFRFFGFLAGSSPVHDPALQVRHPEWHLVYVAGFVVLVGLMAVARHGLRRTHAAWLAAALVLVAAGGWFQTRDVSEAEVARMVDRLLRPERHQVCERYGAVDYCAYPEYSARIARWRTPVEAVLALLPEGVSSRPLSVRQRPETVIGNGDCQPSRFVDGLPAKVRERLDPAAVWEADGLPHPGYQWPDQFTCGGRDARGLFLAVQTGAWAVGLPPTPHGDDVHCQAPGQGRAVAALWLGARAVPDGDVTLDRLLEDHRRWSPGGPYLEFAEWDTPPMWGVQWHTADVAAARALLDAPTARVRSVLADNWDRITDPVTPASELLRLTGVAAPSAVIVEDGALACG